MNRLTGAVLAVGCASGAAGAGGDGVGTDSISPAMAQGPDTLFLEAMWIRDSTVYPGLTVYEVTWTRNGETIGTDTLSTTVSRARIPRAGAGTPDTILVTLWPLYDGVPTKRAVWREHIYRAVGPIRDTIAFGPAPPPDPGGGLAAAAPATLPPAAPAPDSIPPGGAPRAAPLPGSPKLVTLRILGGPPEWATTGLSADCLVGVVPEGPLHFVVVSETAQHCRPYISQYGSRGRGRGRGRGQAP